MVFIGFSREPQVWGLYGCNNRPSSIYRVNLDGTEFGLLYSNGKTSVGAFLANGDQCFFFEYNVGQAHDGCCRLVSQVYECQVYRQKTILKRFVCHGYFRARTETAIYWWILSLHVEPVSFLVFSMWPFPLETGVYIIRIQTNASFSSLLNGGLKR